MVRMTDLQDNLSKTQAVERIFQTMRQQPDTDQRAFAQVVQRMKEQQKEATEPMEQQDEVNITGEKDQNTERSEQKERERKKKKEKSEKRKSGDHNIDITV